MEQDKLFSDREERVLKEFKDIQTRDELESKVIIMITLNKIWFSDIRHATMELANKRFEIKERETHEELIELRNETNDVSASLLIRAQAVALKVELGNLLEWLGFNSLDELLGSEEIVQLNKKEKRMCNDKRWRLNRNLEWMN